MNMVLAFEGVKPNSGYVTSSGAGSHLRRVSLLPGQVPLRRVSLLLGQVPLRIRRSTYMILG